MLAEEGCSVVACQPDPKEIADSFVESITESTGTTCIALQTDVSKENDVYEMNKEVIDKFGGYDILVNNAAIITTALCEDLDLETWEKVLSVNLTGTFLMSKAAIRHFKDKPSGGSIINMTSQSAFRGSKSGQVHYNASKAGIVGLSRTLALEVSKYGINVNVVAPGIVDTPTMAERIKTRREQYERDIPIGRIADPKDIAYAVVFLASVMGKYITGSTLDVSGGIMLR
jgi:3-oxoacyl-[acyl-carrier protein] reductase